MNRLWWVKFTFSNTNHLVSFGQTVDLTILFISKICYFEHWLQNYWIQLHLFYYYEHQNLINWLFFPVHVLVWVRVWLPEESIISSRSRSVGFRHIDALLPLILFVWLFPGVCTTERGIEYRLQVHSWYLFHVTQDKLFGFLPLFWTDLLLFGYK